MVYDYVVTLKNDRGKFVDVISFLVIFLSSFMFLSAYLTLPESFIFLIVSILLAGGIVWNIYRRRKRLQLKFSHLLLVAGVIWFSMPANNITLGHFTFAITPIIASAIILLFVLERPAKLPLEIGFTEDKIVFNNLFRKKRYWEEFNNILLKDGMLTLDYKNNRLFQKETIEEEGDADEDEFNEYCSTHLKLANKE